MLYSIQAYVHTIVNAYCYSYVYLAIAFLQNNEIDLDALLLMSEKDFSEIGLPKVCNFVSSDT